MLWLELDEESSRCSNALVPFCGIEYRGTDGLLGPATAGTWGTSCGIVEFPPKVFNLGVLNADDAFLDGDTVIPVVDPESTSGKFNGTPMA